ncbi:glycogen phosphorylase [Anaerobacillus alkalidiazotrophicus]|uniref:Alpha-1,4 glucan phosphorylase n=1 Tax=Anaerobacillus alkalidiazotrophicus TaxID=472963 RepID=A0A1S2M5S3_9BACI|nr:glycogen/starch/alpha-glucan phosphorylase [Anaerobacillus alkalidiazotrophicus]OIJ18576.1 glycogen phosphorylase [Anaerobacillus alkalidiazotrophicus]OIJ20021.1 glycogen phosphorylase [Anaerobacillus alkalidiazotrophicus]
MFSDKEVFKKEFIETLEYTSSKTLDEASPINLYNTLGTMIRSYVSKNWINTIKTYQQSGEKQVYYFSMEFLLGRLLQSNMLNLNILNIVKEGLDDLGVNIDAIVEQEHDAGLGNGGLGRLAACFLDSIASLQLPGHGCGIRYKYGLFEQKLVDGYQLELPDYWLKEDYVWEVRRTDRSVHVRFGGHVEMNQDNGELTFEHKNYETVLAVPYDVPIVGFDNNTVNTLRLWSAEPVITGYDMYTSDRENYYKFLNYKRSIETISEFLYPDDSHFEGKKLRLKQQYFLVSAGLQSILQSYKRKIKASLRDLPEKIVLHINDTHPALIVPELMRILIDEEGFSWEDAWRITTQTCAYTNHTTLVEALEKWPISLFKELLPRIYMIVEEINERFCRDLWLKYPGEYNRISELAIIADEQVRMAHLAIVGSFSVNGVAKLHTDILKEREMNNFYQVYPEKFNNKTNGITHRRWLMSANPKLASHITDAIGTRWIKQPRDLIGLLKYANDSSFQEKVSQVKLDNKIALAKYIKAQTGIVVDEHSIFDVQVKRLHAYKRQLLNVFHIMELYNLLRENPNLDIVPRTFIFGAKAAPSYFFAKEIIKLINTVANVVNNDPHIQGKLKVVFLENYGVSIAEKIIPAADVSEQISTASKEASGTGNMKFMMNGALTIGTLDGANVEICDMVGRDNIFIFGLTSEEVLNYYSHGGYVARSIYNNDPRVRTVLDQLMDGFCGNDKVEFKDIYYHILSNNDEYFVLKDFDNYVETHQKVDLTYRDQKDWVKKSIVNIAHSGKFSSDRTIGEYATDIWGIRPVIIK